MCDGRWLPGTLLVLCFAVGLGCGGGATKKQEPPPEVDSTQKMRMAQSLMRAGRVGEALEALEEAIAVDPENARLQFSKGQICFNGGLYPEAEQALVKALEIDPYLTDARNYLGAVYQELGRPADAERQYMEALDNPAYPTPERIHLGLGMLYKDMGRYDDAMAELRKSVEINPKFYQAHFEQGAVYEEIGKLTEAVRAYVVAEPGYTRSGEFHYRVGLCYFRLGDRQRAKDHLNRVLALAPGSTSAAEADELLKMLE